MSNETEVSNEMLYSIAVFFRTFGTYSNVLALDSLVLRKDINDAEKGAQLNAMIESTMAEAKEQKNARRA